MLRNILLHFKSFHLSHELLKSVLRFGKNEPICVSVVIEFSQIKYERLGDFSFHWLQHVNLAHINYKIPLIN